MTKENAPQFNAGRWLNFFLGLTGTPISWLPSSLNAQTLVQTHLEFLHRFTTCLPLACRAWSECGSGYKLCGLPWMRASAARFSVGASFLFNNQMQRW